MEKSKTTTPLRERIVRKAKEKAVVSLHELTTNPRQLTSVNSISSPNTTLTNESPAATPKSTSAAVKRNNRSYKPFPELNNQQQASE